jgi:diguanylate cyclase (GGDEF)-like protein
MRGLQSVVGGVDIGTAADNRRDMASSFDRFDTRLRAVPDWAILATGMGVVAAIAVFRITAGHDLLVADFLLIPVAAIGWLVKERAYAYVGAACTAAVTVFVAVSGQAQAQLAGALAAAGVRFALYLVVLALLGAIRQMQLAREKEARTDYLTGAANVRAFGETAQAEIDRCRRYGGPLSLLYLDLDDFKAINDTFGHAAGDAVLAQFCHVMSSTLRASDLVARLGGDEFAVLLPEADHGAALAAVRRLRDELHRVTAPDGRPVRSSVGVASYAAPPLSVDALIYDADSLMYRAKQRGKDCVEAAEFPGPQPAQSAGSAASGAPAKPGVRSTGGVGRGRSRLGPSRGAG